MYDKNKNIKKFEEGQIKRLTAISKEFEGTEQEFPSYDQELVFKVKTSQRVSDKEFRQRLKGVDCETIASALGKNAEWVVSAIDPSFKKLKERISTRATKDKANFIDGILEFLRIRFEDKLGESLKNNPLGLDEKTRLVVSLTKKESDSNNEKLNSALDLIRNLSKENGLEIHDSLVTENVCLLLLDGTLDFAKQISGIDIVESIDRPPRFALEKIVDSTILDVGKNIPPNEKDHGILVMDSGIILHPLLEDAVDEDEGIVGLPDINEHDDRRHGTMVSGIALHGDIEDSITNKKFKSNMWIYSAKIFYEDNGAIKIPNETLIESEIKNNFEKIKQKFPRCRVVNLSFGNPEKIMSDGQRQFDLAVLIDDLANQYRDTVFVISVGNVKKIYYDDHHYPDYLLSSDLDVKIMDPAASIHALSVGAVQKFGHLIDQPSNITRVGPGLNGMIKPDLVENGGGFDSEIVVLNSDYRDRLFTLTMGTSFSSPKIANFVARLFNRFPNASRNLVMALLLSSANLPQVIPDGFPKRNSKTKNENWLKLMSIYGFGRPVLNNALSSDDDRVVFKHEGKIGMNQVQYFTINLPDEFVSIKGKRHISVSLVYDPPIRKTRADYFGVRMEFHLFRNKSLDEIREKYDLINLTESEDRENNVPEKLSKFEIVLHPKPSLRKRSNHQKGVRTLTTRTRLNSKQPLVLAILSQKIWDLDDNFKQDFAVVMTIKHEQSIDLYNKIKIANQIQTRVQV